MMEIKNKFLFNFAASYSGGGFKRLYEYARWFNDHGGAWFITHPRCGSLVNEFPNNRWFIALQPTYQRIVADCRYLDAVGKETGRPTLYYSYGIPIYARFGRINWFHLSNVLPLRARGIPLALFDRFKLGYLGWRIKQNFRNADVISAESDYSLRLIDARQNEKLFLSVNGSDDELDYLRNGDQQKKRDNVATVVGTYKFKALRDSCHVFEMLRARDDKLKLMIIGNEKIIPDELRHDKNIIVTGVLERRDVIACLRRTKYYISTSYIENSYNAASEGIFSADESYVSDIGPHRELLRNMPFDQISVPGMRRPVLYVRRENVSGANLKAWEDVIAELIAKVRVSERDVCSAPL